MKLGARAFYILFYILALSISGSTSAQSPAAPTTEATVPQEPSRPLVYLFIQRMDYLKSKHPAMATEGVGHPNHADGMTPMETVWDLARSSKATSLLYVESAPGARCATGNAGLAARKRVRLSPDGF